MFGKKMKLSEKVEEIENEIDYLEEAVEVINSHWSWDHPAKKYLKRRIKRLTEFKRGIIDRGK
jgi:hypothetical protein